MVNRRPPFFWLSDSLYLKSLLGEPSPANALMLIVTTNDKWKCWEALKEKTVSEWLRAILCYWRSEQCRFGVGEFVEEKSTSNHSKNIMFKRKPRKALYRAVGMTQQATERQPRSGKRNILTGPFSPPSSQTVLWKMGKFSGQRLPTKGKESRTAWVIPVSLRGLDNLLREGFQMRHVLTVLYLQENKYKL